MGSSTSKHQFRVQPANMYTLIVVATVFAAAAAASASTDQLVAVTHDTLGNYNYKYTIDGITKTERADQMGNTVGSYSYINPEGELKKIEYTSGVHGFVPSGLDIPVQVQDTQEVASAKAQHLALLDEAYLSAPKRSELAMFQPGLFPIPLIPLLGHHQILQMPHLLQESSMLPNLKYFILKGSIDDTPEVIAARNAHFLAYLEASKHLH